MLHLLEHTAFRLSVVYSNIAFILHLKFGVGVSVWIISCVTFLPEHEQPRQKFSLTNNILYFNPYPAGTECD